MTAPLPQPLVPGIEGDSIMEQIQKVFEPPGKSRCLSEEQELHPYFKRPGKGHNNDNCDSCKEGGDLICCDSCPASFHFQCHDPPFEEKDIPEGDWICIRCFTAKPENQKLVEKARTKKNSPVKTSKPAAEVPDNNKQASAGAPVKPDKEWKPGGKGKKVEVSKPVRATRTVKKKQYTDNSTEDEESEQEQDTLEPETVNDNRTYKDIYIDHLINRPTNTYKPFLTLLQAVAHDNASEFELPKAINLPEQFPYSWKWSTDEKRRRVEDENGHIMCYVCVKTSRVGPLVTCDYCPLSFHLDCLDPPMSEIPRDVWMCPNHVESYLDTCLSNTRVTERVQLWDKFARRPINDSAAVKLEFMKRCQREKRNDKICRRKVPVNQRSKVSVPGYVQSYYQSPASLLPADDQRWHRPVTRRQDRSEEEMEWVSGLVSLQTDLLKTVTRDKLNNDHSDVTRDNHKNDVTKDLQNNDHDDVRRDQQNNDHGDHDSVKDEVKDELSDDLKCNESLDAKSEDEEEKAVVSPASTLSTCSLSPRHRHQLTSVVSSGAGDQGLVSMLSEYLAQHSTSVADMDPVVVQYLATRQLQSLLGHTAPPDQSRVQARAVLTPLHSRKTPVTMRYRSLSIGRGAGADLDLNEFGQCNMISVKHASIFYDELSDCYELLNYSEHGTVVDEVYYGLDTAMLQSRYPAKLKYPDTSPTMARSVTTDSGPCYCQAGGQVMSGCESSALVHHGSLLQFGCLQFVFSVAERGGGDVEL